MKSVLIFVSHLFFFTLVYGQHADKTAPCIIKGQLINCPERSLKLVIEDAHGELSIDTIQLDEKGNFNHRTYKVTKPQRTSIQQNTTQINDFFIAPGYELTITGDAKDYQTLTNSKKVSGIGAASNRYRFLLDSIFLARKPATGWYEMDEAGLLDYVKTDRLLKDSLMHLVFDKNNSQDKYLGYFGKMVRYDNIFMQLYMLLAYTDIYKYGSQRTIDFINKYADTEILRNLYRDEYLVSSDYKGWMMFSAYPDYLLNLDYEKDSTLTKQSGYKLEKISQVYKGKIREYVLHRMMSSSITYAKSFEELNGYKEQFDKYISSLADSFYRSSIAAKFTRKEEELLRTEIGKPAPAFILQSDNGIIHRLDDYKGKVVYLDLWASWCAPCRAEIPAFKLLYDKYKTDDRVIFISVAVSDGEKEWRKALQQDQPGWLQLFDKGGLVARSYVANAIPKFILIDKKGLIVNFDAPAPGSGQTIEKLLNLEMAK